MRLRILAMVPIWALLGACATFPLDSFGPRTIVLNGQEIREDDVGEFLTWRCADYFDEWSEVVVEVGIFSNSEVPNAGFILYDGENSGDFAIYMRDGLNRRWSWGSGESNYSFIIKPDNTGLYYDFT